LADAISPEKSGRANSPILALTAKTNSRTFKNAARGFLERSKSFRNGPQFIIRKIKNGIKRKDGARRERILNLNYPK